MGLSNGLLHRRWSHACNSVCLARGSRDGGAQRKTLQVSSTVYSEQLDFCPLAMARRYTTECSPLGAPASVAFFAAAWGRLTLEMVSIAMLDLPLVPV